MVANHRVTFLPEVRMTPWDGELPSDVEEVTIDAAGVERDGRMQCQITVDGAITVIRADARVTCAWKR